MERVGHAANPRGSGVCPRANLAQTASIVRPMNPSYLFVYGTLDPQHAPAVIRPAVLRLRLVGQATVRGQLFDFGRYPGVVLEESADLVHGRLFELPEDDGVTLAAFDHYEGYTATAPHRLLFKRVPCRVNWDDQPADAWIYVYARPVDNGRRVLSGRWRESG